MYQITWWLDCACLSPELWKKSLLFISLPDLCYISLKGLFHRSKDKASFVFIHCNLTFLARKMHVEVLVSHLAHSPNTAGYLDIKFTTDTICLRLLPGSSCKGVRLPDCSSLQISTIESKSRSLMVWKTINRKGGGGLFARMLHRTQGNTLPT